MGPFLLRCSGVLSQDDCCVALRGCGVLSVAFLPMFWYLFGAVLLMPGGLGLACVLPFNYVGADSFFFLFRLCCILHCCYFERQRLFAIQLRLCVRQLMMILATCPEATMGLSVIVFFEVGSRDFPTSA